MKLKRAYLSTKQGFTLIELLVIMVIIGILSAVILASLGSSRNRTYDTKIISQMGQMTSQGFLFQSATGFPDSAYVSGVRTTIANPAAAGTDLTGTLFNTTTPSYNSLYSLASTLPSGTRFYYGWDGADPNLTGRWFFAATLSVGAFCNDNKGTKKVYVGTPPTTVANFTAAGAFPNATALGGYRCD